MFCIQVAFYAKVDLNNKRGRYFIDTPIGKTTSKNREENLRRELGGLGPKNIIEFTYDN